MSIPASSSRSRCDLDRVSTRKSTLQHLVLVAGTVVTLALLTSCATETIPNQALETTKYTLDNTDKFAALDETTAHTIACTGVQHFTHADGKLEVIANLKNHGSRRLDLQASCLFRDEQGLPLGSETAWQPLTITENTTQAVHFTAPIAGAKKYTIRVRQAR